MMVASTQPVEKQETPKMLSIEGDDSQFFERIQQIVESLDKSSEIFTSRESDDQNPSRAWLKSSSCFYPTMPSSLQVMLCFCLMVNH
jgi:hypothetical protein